LRQSYSAFLDAAILFIRSHTQERIFGRKQLDALRNLNDVHALRRTAAVRRRFGTEQFTITEAQKNYPVFWTSLFVGVVSE